jgi:hypothetical protein
LPPAFELRPQAGGTVVRDQRAVFTTVVYVLTTGCAWQFAIFGQVLHVELHPATLEGLKQPEPGLEVVTEVVAVGHIPTGPDERPEKLEPFIDATASVRLPHVRGHPHSRRIDAHHPARASRVLAEVLVCLPPLEGNSPHRHCPTSQMSRQGCQSGTACSCRRLHSTGSGACAPWCRRGATRRGRDALVPDCHSLERPECALIGTNITSEH